MITFLNGIRAVKVKHSIQKQLFAAMGIMAAGILLGAFSKYLDCTPGNELPYLLESLDIRNFLGRFAIWIFIAVCISVYSSSPLRAAVNVFVFFVGMVGAYYLYTVFIAGFFPKSYMMIWIGFTLISPLLAFACWYARGKGAAAIVISAGIIGVLFDTAFAWGIGYVSVKSPLELIILVLGIIVLHRDKKETVIMIGLGVVIAIVYNIVSPYHFW